MQRNPSGEEAGGTSHLQGLLKAQLGITGEVWPGANLLEQSFPRALGGHQLAVAQQSVVGAQEACTHGTAWEVLANDTQGPFRGQLLAVVADDGHAEAQGVVASGVGAQPVPAAALVHVAVGAHHEAAGR